MPIEVLQDNGFSDFAECDPVPKMYPVGMRGFWQDRS
ncbi:hypothetical protein NSU_pLA1104 (plasmid) [Novosphingobium pentaromativorans US6-1]|uniref:Uncharacterized protein n=1 Tax=Novosphingobium pentaromativorans US6-1 TaxID=1088721 RepID=G6EL31_9SPHN|nr:hypothetical protein NSU_pLA1104 [Novosphingobium pentaromativorans US6-1]